MEKFIEVIASQDGSRHLIPVSKISFVKEMSDGTARIEWDARGLDLSVKDRYEDVIRYLLMARCDVANWTRGNPSRQVLS